jgi:hypothetical protein
MTALYQLHRVLIGFAIAFGAIFAAYSALSWRASGSPLALALAILSLAAAVTLGAYLRWFLRARQAPPPPGARS